MKEARKTIPCFPDPLPDEILYSVWARYSDRVQYSHEGKVTQELFGDRGVGVIVDLPCYLDYFVEHLPPGNSYTADWLVDNHTLFPFFGPFLSQERYHGLHEQMISRSGSALHTRSGISGVSIPSPSALRYCPICVKRDREQHGEAYWHRLHQVPGVEICPDHMTILENSTVYTRTNYSLRKFISLERSIPFSPPRTPEDPLRKFLFDIAMEARYLLDHPDVHPDLDFLQQQYLALLAWRGFTTATGLVRIMEFTEAFVSHYSPELLSLLHCEIRPSEVRNKTWLSYFLPRLKKMRHPLQHILVIHFLGSNVDAFFTHPLESPQIFRAGPWPCLNPVCEHYHERRIMTFRIRENSPKGRPVGIFACSCGFVYSRCGPDQIDEDAFRRDWILSYGTAWQEKLRELWLNPKKSLVEIADHLGCSPRTVLHQADELHLPTPRQSIWSQKSHPRQRNREANDTAWHREQWLALVESAPDESRSALRHRSLKLHNWLYRYDREWLLAHSPRRRLPERRLYSPEVLQGINTPRNENYCDASTAESIRAVARDIINNADCLRKVTLKNINKQVPIAGKLRLQAEKAPLTVQALQEVLETTEAFALRRLHRAVQEYQRERVSPTQARLIRRAGLSRIWRTPLILQAIEESITLLRN